MPDEDILTLMEKEATSVGSTALGKFSHPGVGIQHLRSQIKHKQDALSAASSAPHPTQSFVHLRTRRSAHPLRALSHELSSDLHCSASGLPAAKRGLVVFGVHA